MRFTFNQFWKICNKQACPPSAAYMACLQTDTDSSYHLSGIGLSVLDCYQLHMYGSSKMHEHTNEPICFVITVTRLTIFSKNHFLITPLLLAINITLNCILSNTLGFTMLTCCSKTFGLFLSSDQQTGMVLLRNFLTQPSTLFWSSLLFSTRWEGKKKRNK